MSVIHQEGLAMPVDQELINIILNEAGNSPPHKAKITAVSLLFKDLSYSAEKAVTILSKYVLFHAMINGILITSPTSVIWGRYTSNWKRKLISAGVSNMFFLLMFGDLPVNAGRSYLNSGNPTLFSITLWTSTLLPFSGKANPAALIITTDMENYLWLLTEGYVSTGRTGLSLRCLLHG